MQHLIQFGGNSGHGNCIGDTKGSNNYSQQWRSVHYPPVHYLPLSKSHTPLMFYTHINGTKHEATLLPATSSSICNRQKVKIILCLPSKTDCYSCLVVVCSSTKNDYCSHLVVLIIICCLQPSKSDCCSHLVIVIIVYSPPSKTNCRSHLVIIVI